MAAEALPPTTEALSHHEKLFEATKVEPSPTEASGSASELDSRAESSEPLSLRQLVQELTKELQTKPGIALHKRTHIESLLQRFDHSREEWKRFEMYDERYTRNLIATDHKTFTLLLLCWNKAQESPIHDHPCDGCWVKVVRGSVREVRYTLNEDTRALDETSTMVASTGDVTFIHDSMGFHKVGNPSTEEYACTLHLYAPPIRKCKVWLNPDNANEFLTPVVTHFSEHGRRVEYK